MQYSFVSSSSTWTDSRRTVSPLASGTSPTAGTSETERGREGGWDVLSWVGLDLTDGLVDLVTRGFGFDLDLDLEVADEDPFVFGGGRGCRYQHVSAEIGVKARQCRRVL